MNLLQFSQFPSFFPAAGHTSFSLLCVTLLSLLALSRLVVEASILLAASRGNPTVILKEAAATYKVDTEAITTKVRQEFAAKEKAKKAAQPVAKAATKAA